MFQLHLSDLHFFAYTGAIYIRVLTVYRAILKLQIISKFRVQQFTNGLYIYSFPCFVNVFFLRKLLKKIYGSGCNWNWLSHFQQQHHIEILPKIYTCFLMFSKIFRHFETSGHSLTLIVCWKCIQCWKCSKYVQWRSGVQKCNFKSVETRQFDPCYRKWRWLLAGYHSSTRF